MSGYFDPAYFDAAYFATTDGVTPPVPEPGGGTYRDPRFRPVVTRRPDDDELLFWIL